MLDVLKEYQDAFAPQIPTMPQGRFACIVVLRETMTFSIFTTEGGEEGLDQERVPAGISDAAMVDRVLLIKRKQVAAERRVGRALLRGMGVIAEEATDAGPSFCVLGAITEEHQLCGACPDCLVYGYVSGESARRSRVFTDTAFTIRAYEDLQRRIKFNVIDEANQRSGTITEYEHLRPGVILPSVETCADLTAEEFCYVLGNILRTTRYGKEASRQGYVRNHLLGVALSNVELFSNLELTQAFWDVLGGKDGKLPEKQMEELRLADVQNAWPVVRKTLGERLVGNVRWMEDGQLSQLRDQLTELYSDRDKLQEFVEALQARVAEARSG